MEGGILLDMRKSGPVCTVLIVMFILSALSPAAAESDADLQACLSAPTAAQSSGMNECLGRAAEAWSRRIELAYQQLNAKLDPPSRRLLQASQQAWNSYREKELAFANGPWREGGGTFAQTNLSALRLEELRDRARILEGYLLSK